MKLSATITERKEVEREIELPYFCKKGNSYFKILTEETTLKVEHSKGYSSIVRTETWLFKTEIAEAIEVPELEFIEKMEDAVNSIYQDEVQMFTTNLTA